MSFFYGLVSQRGPFKETETDFIRLTTPQYQLGIDPQISSMIDTSKLQASQKTSGITGAGGDDRAFRGKPINGLENTLGLTQDIVNAYVEKASDPNFVNGQSGGVDQTYLVANILDKLRKSTLYNYAVRPVEDALRTRFESTKAQLSKEDFVQLNSLINNTTVTLKEASEIIALNTKVAEWEKKMAPEAAYAKAQSEASSPVVAQKLAQFLDGRLTIPGAQQIVYLQEIESPETKSPPVSEASSMSVTPRASVNPRLAIEDVQMAVDTQPVKPRLAIEDVQMADLLPETGYVNSPGQVVPKPKRTRKNYKSKSQEDSSSSDKPARKSRK